MIVVSLELAFAWLKPLGLTNVRALVAMSVIQMLHGFLKAAGSCLYLDRQYAVFSAPDLL